MLTRRMRATWGKAGMQSKFKIFFGLYQCLSVVPTIFNVRQPQDVDGITFWLYVLEFADKLGSELIVPGQCLGSHPRRLLVDGLWPIALIVCIFLFFVLREAVRQREIHTVQPDGSRHSSKHAEDRGSRSRRSSLHIWLDLATPSYRSGIRQAAWVGTQKSIPSALILTFVLLPSRATLIFETFKCDRFLYDDNTGEVKRYLGHDYSNSCDSESYDASVTVALWLLVIWPIGVPLMYARLLWMARDALRTGAMTAMKTSISFLYRDYR